MRRDWSAGSIRWVWRLVYWIPALLSVFLLVLIGWRLGPGGTGVVNSGALVVLFFAIPPLFLNLVFFLVPIVIESPAIDRSRLLVVPLGLGAALWGGVAFFSIGPENDVPQLFPISLGILFLHCLGVAVLTRSSGDRKADDPSQT